MIAWTDVAYMTTAVSMAVSMSRVTEGAFKSIPSVPLPSEVSSETVERKSYLELHMLL